jgi:pyrimidine precursor biosynthesis enzyme
MKAIKRASDFMFADPVKAYELFVEMKPHMNSEVNRKIFQRSFRYFSRDFKNVQRDWDKVTNYCKRLEIVDQSFEQNQTNEFLDWPLLPEGPAGVEPATVDTGVLACCGCKGYVKPTVEASA